MIWRDAYRTREHHTVIVVSHRARSKSSASLRAIARSNARPPVPPARVRSRVLDRPLGFPSSPRLEPSRLRAPRAARRRRSPSRPRVNAHLFHRLRSNATHVDEFARVVQRRIARRAARSRRRGSRVFHTRIITDTRRPTARAPRSPSRARVVRHARRPRSLLMFAVSSTRVVVNAANTSGTKRVAAKKPAAGKVRRSPRAWFYPEGDPTARARREGARRARARSSARDRSDRCRRRRRTNDRSTSRARATRRSAKGRRRDGDRSRARQEGVGR